MARNEGVYLLMTNLLTLWKEAYSKDLLERAQKIALQNGIKVVKGVYACVPGPSQTTRSELSYITTIGAGMHL